MTIVGTRRMIVYDDLQKRTKKSASTIRGSSARPHHDTFADFHYSYT